MEGAGAAWWGGGRGREGGSYRCLHPRRARGRGLVPPWICVGQAAARAAQGSSQWGLGLEQAWTALGGCCLYPPQISPNFRSALSAVAAASHPAQPWPNAPPPATRQEELGLHQAVTAALGVEWR